MIDPAADIPVPFRRHEPLAPFTTFRIGGPADLLLLPRSAAEFAAGVRWAGACGLPLTVLGGGSNVLVADAGVAGAVILTTGLERIEAAGGSVWAEAGVDMSNLCERCAGLGLAGLQNFYGMPGTLGGAVFMNARCYERSIADVVDSVCAIDVAGRETELPAAACDFAYKRSRFQGGREWIAGVRLRLAPGGDAGRLRAEMAEFRRRRESMGQYLLPNAGCIFKNDYRVGTPSGKIIESCGLKGERLGDAEVFARHANFIVNHGAATAADVLSLIRRVERQVAEQTGLRLEREIQLVGRWGDDAGV
jgi:UDP-N-acetylmuramate dehydrogenase